MVALVKEFRDAHPGHPLLHEHLFVLRLCELGQMPDSAVGAWLNADAERKARDDRRRGLALRLYKEDHDLLRRAAGAAAPACDARDAAVRAADAAEALGEDNNAAQTAALAAGSTSDPPVRSFLG